MHGFQRAQQTKKPLWQVMMKAQRRVFQMVVLYLLVLCGLFSVTTWLFLRDVPYEEEVQEVDVWDYIF
jgi:hypothetical protein